MESEGTMRERAIALLASTRYLLSVPPARWPLAWHASIAAVFGICACVLLYGQRSWEQGRVIASKQTLAQAQRDLAAISSAPSSETSVVPLGEAGAIDRVVDDAGKFAAKASINIASLRIEPPSPSSNKIAKQWRIVFKCNGEYTAIKNWIAELTGRYPWLALSAITIHPNSPDDRQLETTITLDLFEKAQT
jgi:hypothetical protein